MLRIRHRNGSAECFDRGWTALLLQQEMQTDVRYGSWPCKNDWVRGVFEVVPFGEIAFWAGYALIATISGRTPMMLITRVIL
jgi:hypothetical protein